MSPIEHSLSVIANVSKGHYGVKVLSDGAILIMAGGYMQADGSIGESPDPNFNKMDHLGHLVLELVDHDKQK